MGGRSGRSKGAAGRRRAAPETCAVETLPASGAELLDGPIDPKRLREALRRYGPSILAQPRVQAQLEAWWLTMRMLPRYVEWSGRPYAHARGLDFLREAREGLLGIGEALVVKGKAGRPRRARLSAEALRSGVRVALHLVREGQRRWRAFALVPPEDVFHPGFSSFARTLKIRGRVVDLARDQAREIAILAVARAANTSVREVREAIAGRSKSSRKC